MKWYVYIVDSQDRVIERDVCYTNKERFNKTKEFESKLIEGQRVNITKHNIE